MSSKTTQNNEKTKFTMSNLGTPVDHCVLNSQDISKTISNIFLGCKSKFAINHEEDAYKQLKLIRYVSLDLLDPSVMKTKTYGKYKISLNLDDNPLKWEIKAASHNFRIVNYNDYTAGTVKIYDEEITEYSIVRAV